MLTVYMVQSFFTLSRYLQLSDVHLSEWATYNPGITINTTGIIIVIRDEKFVVPTSGYKTKTRRPVQVCYSLYATRCTFPHVHNVMRCWRTTTFSYIKGPYGYSNL